MKQSIKYGIVSILLFITFSVIPIWAGTTGKIAGIITDKNTNEPLIGANIMIVGTSLGAATDIEGRYTIIRRSRQAHTRFQISYIGYARQL
jgi:hypothetical protein